jgi:hypothetical protein
MHFLLSITYKFVLKDESSDFEDFKELQDQCKNEFQFYQIGESEDITTKPQAKGIVLRFTNKKEETCFAVTDFTDEFGKYFYSLAK